MLRRSCATAATLLMLITGCAPAAAPKPTARPAPAAATEPCATGGLSQSAIQTAAPTPTRTTAPATTAAATPVPTSASPTPTPRPAPTADRVGFPEDYQTKFKFAYVYDRQDAKSVSYICFNDIAAATKQGQAFPYGSVIVFESWRPREDAQGALVKDANGHMIRESLNAIFVMRKEPGFGEAYQASRTGEWEYVAYRPDKSFQTPPQGSGTCAACHFAGGNAKSTERDWTFRAWTLPFTTTRWAQAPLPGPTEVSLNRMAFFPNVLTVKTGTAVKWINSIVDQIDHAVNANDNSFTSPLLKPGDSFSQTFTKAGTYLYFCPLHPDQMRARIEVKD